MAVFSNGGFDGIHAKLLEQLNDAPAAEKIESRNQERDLRPCFPNSLFLDSWFPD